MEELARNQILDHLNRRFKGHDMAWIVEAILQAEGYVTRRSDPGADGGVDILAGAGSMGIDSPRLCVQVKSSQLPADVIVLRSLQTSMRTFGAEQGLLVCWGGFTRAVMEEARRSFFTVRPWHAGNVLEALFKSYDRLSAVLQAELPLKRIWALVAEGA